MSGEGGGTGRHFRLGCKIFKVSLDGKGTILHGTGRQQIEAVTHMTKGIENDYETPPPGDLSKVASCST